MSELLEAAKVHIDRSEIPQAVEKLTAHLNTDFHDADALFMLGACHLQLGHNGLAAALTRQSLEIKAKLGKRMPEGLKNLGACFKAENRMEAARELWKLALEIEDVPAERAQILSNIGGSYINAGQPAEAIRWLDQALAIIPGQPHFRFNRGLAALEQGDWPNGWRDYDVGFLSGDRRYRRYKGLPEWDGTSGRKVIVWGDQGVGDEIMFGSMLPDLVACSERVIFDCHPRLTSLWQRSFPAVEVHGTRKVQSHLDWLPDCDADCSVPLSSLGRWFRQRDEDFPGKPYLKAPRKPPADGVPNMRVGISWKGGTPRTRSDLRSIPLAPWAPLLGSVDAEFYSLQYHADSAKDVALLEEATGVRVRHFPGWVECKDYDRTASFVASMDLVITIPTTVWHLAGGLGVPTWLLVPSAPPWTCGTGGERWYGNTCRFFRQAEGEDWQAVLGRVGEAIADNPGVCRAEPAAA